MAHTFSNIGFETAGASVGYALAWTIAIMATAEEYAGYGTTNPDAWEDFEEEWANGNQDTYYTLPATALATYDTTPAEDYEDFEEEWSNEPHTWVLSGTATASYDTTVFEDYEDFEEEWGDNEDGIFVFDVLSLTVASYDLIVPEDVEDFEEEWRDNEDDILEFTGGDIITAQYDGSENFEDFEEVDLRMYTAEVTAIGADGDKLIVYVNGSPVTRNCTGVGTVNTERDFLISSVNAAGLGANATADGTGKIKFRATTSGDSLSVKVEATGATAKIVLLDLPDKTAYWTQSGELAE